MSAPDTTIVPQDEATGHIYIGNGAPIRVFGNDFIRNTFDEKMRLQAYDSRMAPGVTGLALMPDAHIGYGTPIGCVMLSPTHIYPGPVGVDINCSMSLLQLDLPEDAISERPLRRAIIQAIEKRIPTGSGFKEPPKKRRVSNNWIELGLIEGATPEVCDELQIPREWASRCEDSTRVGSDGTVASLDRRLDYIKANCDVIMNGPLDYSLKLQQLGSYGAGNHFGECEVVELAPEEINAPTSKVAETFGLLDGHIAFFSHCGSRGFGGKIARHQFDLLKKKFDMWGIPIPGNDPELVYAPLGTPEANDYIDDMVLGANFATLNHLMINSLVLEAFQEVIPGVQGNLVYHISHNVARVEHIEGQDLWIHRKGATRAYPAGHPSLQNTPFAETGHPILLPGNPIQGSSVMVALPGAEKSYYSLNHGAGRSMGRNEAKRRLDQNTVDRLLDSADILTNSREYPIDEAPQAYKDFNQVLNSVKSAGLAREVAKLRAKFVIKDDQ